MPTELDEPTRSEVTERDDAEADLDISLLEYLQTLSPAQRLERHEAALALVRALRAAGREHYGFDPRTLASANQGEG